jgi:hypothetical protein
MQGKPLIRFGSMLIRSYATPSQYAPRFLGAQRTASALRIDTSYLTSDQSIIVDHARFNVHGMQKVSAELAIFLGDAVSRGSPDCPQIRSRPER